jgi:peroxiredoxin Q/BCP
VIQEGDRAPGFDLPSSEGGSLSLAGLKGRSVVLYFYPKDLTPGCTKQACGFRDAKAALKRSGAVLLGVSPDSLDSHEAFRSKHRLNFPLLSDADRAVAKAYGAWGPKLMYGRKVTGMIRSTFVIDGKGIVRKVFPRVRVDGHAEQVLEALKSL